MGAGGSQRGPGDTGGAGLWQELPGLSPPGDTVICCGTVQIAQERGRDGNWVRAPGASSAPTAWTRGKGNLIFCPEPPELLLLPAPSQRQGMEAGAWHFFDIVLELILICGEE